VKTTQHAAHLPKGAANKVLVPANVTHEAVVHRTAGFDKRHSSILIGGQINWNTCEHVLRTDLGPGPRRPIGNGDGCRTFHAETPGLADRGRRSLLLPVAGGKNQGEARDRSGRRRHETAKEGVNGRSSLLVALKRQLIGRGRWSACCGKADFVADAHDRRRRPHSRPPLPRERWQENVASFLKNSVKCSGIREQQSV
jgi:hypothetical protein